MKKLAEFVPWVFALFICYIYLWYLQYKFLGHPGSVELFTTLTDWLGFHGYEKVMRIFVGSMELCASILLLIPATQVVGAAWSFGIITGAIFFHLATPLGVDPYGDGGFLPVIPGGVLFHQALCVWVSSVAILVLRRRRALELIDRYLPFVPVPAKLRAL